MGVTVDLFGECEQPAIKESQLQISLVKILQRMLRPDVLMRHIPAGGMDARTGAKLKMMGRMAGCADLEFMWVDAHGFLRVLFLELKLPGRTLTSSQEHFKRRVRPLGPYYVATTINEALETLRTYDLLQNASISTALLPKVA